MWNRLPLNSKLIISLVLVQASALVIGAVWLSQRTQTSRMHELARRLDTKSDVVEDMIVVNDDKVSFDLRNEMARELNLEKDVYFELVRSDGEVPAESDGAPEPVRSLLRKTLTGSDPKNERSYLIEVQGNHWLVQSEIVDRKLGSEPRKLLSHVALRAQPVLNEIAQFRQAIGLAAFALLLVTTLGSSLVVSYSTRNLRAFAHQIREVTPPRFTGEIRLVPQSAEERLIFDSYKEMIQTIKKSIETQRLFIAHASHELKTPIAAAMAATEVVLSRNRSAAEYEGVHREVLGELKVLKRLSGALLDLARLDEESSGSNEQHNCSLRAVILLVVERWSRAAAAKNISIQSDFGGDDETFLSGRQDQWEVVIGNLTDNAVKYGKVGGSVSIEARKVPPEGIEIVVKDDGIGMRRDEVARLGEVFFRADAARSETGSFGLGFAHAQRIVAQLGGSVVVESRPDIGTKIVISAKEAT